MQRGRVAAGGGFVRRYGTNPGGSVGGPKVYGNAENLLSSSAQEPSHHQPASASHRPPMITPTAAPNDSIVQKGRRAGQSREHSRGSNAGSVNNGFHEPQSRTNLQDFIAAKHFEGPKEGYMFSMGDRGIGYYLDDKKASGGPAAASVQPTAAAAGRRKLTVVTPRDARAEPQRVVEQGGAGRVPQSQAEYARQRWKEVNEWEEAQADKLQAPWGQDPTSAPPRAAPRSPAERIKADRNFGSISKNEQNMHALANSSLPSGRANQSMMPVSPIAPHLVEEGAPYIRCIQKQGELAGYEFKRGNLGLGYYIQNETTTAPEKRPAAGKPVGKAGKPPPRRAGGGGGGQVIGGGIASKHKPTSLW